MNWRDIDTEWIRRRHWLVVRVLFVDNIVEFPVTCWRITFTHMGFRMCHSFLKVMVVLVPRLNLVQKALKLFRHFQRDVIGACTSKLKYLCFGRCICLLLACRKVCLRLIIEDAFCWRFSIFKKLSLQFLLRSIGANCSVTQVLSGKIIKWLFNDKVVAVVSNVFDSFIQLAKVCFNFFLVDGLFHALWESNL